MLGVAEVIYQDPACTPQCGYMVSNGGYLVGYTEALCIGGKVECFSRS